MPNRRTRKWRLRLWLGSLCQRLAWRLTDPHDSWMMDYYDSDGHACCRTIRGFYSVARSQAKRVKGKIVGWKSQPMHPEGE